ncbi:leucine-rich repeats and immunoglobulin-like domains protein 3 [Athalia rosae]|uniref:leucine-rich repeats and immunoglobulin-like domains protein 3 n=1 Tax=Athalia rosae TaxID=37344 RepID=UPI0020337709|nr:leucine-rich repeats and immunoglobulin-like domains protein 3 [Athalia rosae]XP_048506129.1 leucine-rich repeats and immunoglobulin-like domains protein 3 [Athalia rosae]XP_048506130.1 leucine-rich repeats and immunoglobulin-like domains protein 3 [Athalia rosae]
MDSLLRYLLIPLAFANCKSIPPGDPYDAVVDAGVLKSVRILAEKSDHLNLSNLGIVEIEPGVFEDVKVKKLTLEFNKIGVLTSDMFSGVGPYLEELNLASNDIGISLGAFTGMDNLKILDISKNPLSSIIHKEFAGIPRNAEIIVKDNSIRTINARSFDILDEEEDDDENGYNRKKRTGFWDVPADVPTDELTPLGESIHILTLVDHIVDDEDTHPNQKSETRVVVCIENSVLLKVGVLEDGEKVEANCNETIIDRGVAYVNLENLGIRSVAKNWYQLHQIRMNYIDLNNNQIEEFSPELVNDLPKSVSILDLSNNLIKHIRKDSGSNENMKMIILRNNLIEDIEPGSFEFPKLWGLYLSGNKIEDISFISSLPESTCLLYLNRNNIERIPQAVFSRLKNLYQLNLGSNKIPKVHDNAFEGLDSLIALNMDKNQISEIDEGGFNGLKNISYIYLSENLLSKFNGGTFSGLRQLEELKINKNKFRKIGIDVIGRLPVNLKTLELKDNGIEDIEPGYFANVPKDTLATKDHKITGIQQARFDSQVGNFMKAPNSIQHLHLSGNLIREILPGTLEGLNSLIDLDIGRNPITRLVNGAFHGIAKTYHGYVSIEDNKLEVIEAGIFGEV